ncbi:MAG: hypothetical protein WB780_05825 [Candidatus Acidiferrales bacterium]
MKPALIALILLLPFACVKSYRSIQHIGDNPQSQSADSEQKTNGQKSPSPKPTVIFNETNTYQAENKPPDTPEKKNEDTKINRWLMRFTGALVFVAALQLGILVWQILTSRNAARHELRAYLGISKIYLDISNPAIPTGIVEIKNFGRTPAYNVGQWAGIMPGNFPLDAEPPRLSAQDAPGSSSTLSMDIPQSTVVSLKKALPPDVTFGSPKGITIYVYGEVTYADIFKKKRRTTFRYLYGGTEQLVRLPTESGKTLGIMKPDVKGNDAD